MKEVTVYSTTRCSYCRQAAQFLTARGVPFKNIDVTDDDAMRAKLVALSGGLRTVPQIFIGGKSVGGYTDLVALAQRGELDAMLKEESPDKPG